MFTPLAQEVAEMLIELHDARHHMGWILSVGRATHRKGLHEPMCIPAKVTASIHGHRG